MRNRTIQWSVEWEQDREIIRILEAREGACFLWGRASQPIIIRWTTKQKIIRGRHSIKGTGDAVLVVEESPIKVHQMSQVGNFPWARIGSLFQTPTVCLIQHSPNWSQGQTALFLVKSTCGPTHNANKGNQWVATMWFSWLQRPMKVFCQNMQIGMKMGVRVDFGETVIWNLYVINLLFSTLRTRLCFRRGGIVRIMRKGELVTTVRILIS